MAPRSAGILLYRTCGKRLQVLLAHPGGPFWRHKDEGAWTIPKGEVAAGEDAEAAARREFTEETGAAVSGPLLALGQLRQKGGKVVDAFAAEGDVDPASVRSNSFSIEWPPRSGQLQSFPEIDRVAWLSLDEARQKILPAQAPLLALLGHRLGLPEGPGR